MLTAALREVTPLDPTMSVQPLSSYGCSNLGTRSSYLMRWLVQCLLQVHRHADADAARHSAVKGLMCCSLIARPKSACC